MKQTVLQSAPHSPMEVAFKEAEAARARDEVPVGAVVTDNAGKIIAQARLRHMPVVIHLRAQFMIKWHADDLALLLIEALVECRDQSLRLG